MKTDTSYIEELPNIDTNSCIFIHDQNNIEVFTGDTGNTYQQTTFTLFGNSYRKTGQTSGENNFPPTKECYTLQDFKELPSKYDFIDPIYQSLAIGTFALIIIGIYTVIIKPFLRGGF